VGCAVGGLVEDWVTEPDLDFELPLDAGGEDAQARRRVLGGLRQGSLPYTIHADSALRYRHTIRGLVHPSHGGRGMARQARGSCTSARQDCCIS